ncbi:MAG: hypothetical protein KAW52_03845 [candidate division Zixibacteria bacterium]|nr:hypothetical protein [candidate division Zixibacteria bacterium]
MSLEEMDLGSVRAYFEFKARDIVLTDRRSAIKLRRYLNKKESSISRPVRESWNQQAKLVTIDTTKKALEKGRIPAEWKEGWREKIREFVGDTVVPAWIKSIKESGDDVSKRVNRLQLKQFDFNVTMTSVKDWVDTAGGKLIVDLSAAQIGSIQALLQSQIALGVTSPYILAQRIRPIVGLTVREAMAVARVMTTLTEEGVSAGVINDQVGNYAKFLHKNRAARIARTELSNGYNFGHLDSVRQANAEGWLPGIPEKDWIAGGANPCDICTDNEGMGFIKLDAEFISGDQHPTAHPHCECSLGSRIRR